MRRITLTENWPLLLGAFGWAAMLAIASALPHGSSIFERNPWAAWQLTPAVSVPLLLAGALYVAGAWRGPGRQGAGGRHAAFAAGLLTIFIALQSPIEGLADHSLAVHEVEHMLLRTVGPMLLVLADPQARLLRGLPAWLRRGLVAPSFSARAVRLPFGILAKPVVATALFVGVGAFWMLPRYHDLALADDRVHWLMHISLIVTGLLFFVRLLDPRHPPYGPSLAARLLMCWFAVITTILIGFAVTFSPHVLYPGYQSSGLLWGVSPRLNEIYGGQTGWIPGSMMLIVALLATVYRWARQEDRDADRRSRDADRVVVGGAEFAATQRPRNRALALGLIGFAVMVLGLAFGSVLVYEASPHHGFPPLQRGGHHVAG
ncbi:MAG: cytochrome c oxidase assembly protein [Alphaproteobacteria bacterium]|nr:cytochrome c oxidase assembly protein [Alphaproteobacteria bacterium]